MTEAPHSTEAEQSVLGAVLTDADAWPAVSHLTAGDFYREDHRLIWGSVERLASIGAAHDALTVADRLEGDGREVLERAGGLPYLTTLAVDFGTGPNVAAYAGIVRARARLRAIAKAGADAAELARVPGADPTDIEARARSMLDALPASEREGWPAVTAGDLLGEEDESLDWLVDDLLPAGGTSLLFGSPKSGKSSLARVLASKVAIGAPWHGRRTAGGPVLYAALDERRATVREHVRTLANGCAPMDADRLRDRLHLVFGPRPAGGVAALRAVVERIQPAPVLVVVDTLMKLEPFEDANDYGQSGQSMAKVTALAHDTGAHLLLVHHSRKDRSGDADLATAALGSTRIGADVDVLARVTVRDTDDRRLVSFIGRDGVNAADIDVSYASAAPADNPYA